MNLTKIAETVSQLVSAAAPVIEAGATAFAPEASAAIGITEKVLIGVLAEVPQAVALYNQIVNGTPPTPEQLAQFEASYEADYQKTKADIAAALAKLG